MVDTNKAKLLHRVLPCKYLKFLFVFLCYYVRIIDNFGLAVAFSFCLHKRHAHFRPSPTYSMRAFFFLLFVCLACGSSSEKESDLDIPWERDWWIHSGMAFLCVIFAAIAAGMTMGLLSVEPMQLQIILNTNEVFFEKICCSPLSICILFRQI